MNKHQPNGFSLIELLIATAISIILGSSVLLVLVSQTQLTATQNRNMLAAEQVRAVLNYMADEIEMMGNGVPSLTSTPPNTPPPFWISNASPQDLTFLGDIDGDAKPDKIRYFLNGTQLQRTLSTSNDNGATYVLVGTDTLIPNVDIRAAATKTVGGQAGVKTGFYFTYFKKDGGVPATTQEITAVQINVGLDNSLTETGLTAGKLAPQYFITYATIRNRSL